MIRPHLVLVATVLSLALACSEPAAPPGGGASAPADTVGGGAEGTFLSLSDIHFDPFYDPALFGELMATEASGWGDIFATSTVAAIAPTGADSNDLLLRAALDAARAAEPDPDFVVVSGDFLAHGFTKSFASALDQLSSSPAPGDCRADDRPPLQCFIDRTIEYVAMGLRRSFPDVPIYPALGNNDSYCGDYEIDPVGPFVERTGDTWSRLLIDAPNRAPFEATFDDGGYYAVVAGGSDARLIVLNTNLFSSHYRDACALADIRARRPLTLRTGDAPGAERPPAAGRGDDVRPAGSAAPDVAAAQLRWLDAQLAQARSAGEGALLLYHIPAGTDVYATLAHGDPTTIDGLVEFWNPEYTATFLDVIGPYADTLRGILAGHTHMDQFVLAPDEPAGAANLEHVTPAISPLFGNNPAFERFRFDRDDARLFDYTSHFLPIAGGPPTAGDPSWQVGYRFSDAYSLPAVSAATMADLWSRLAAAGPERTRFQRYFNAAAGTGTTFAGTAWAAYWCGLGTVTAAEFVACHERAAAPAR